MTGFFTKIGRALHLVSKPFEPSYEEFNQANRLEKALGLLGQKVDFSNIAVYSKKEKETKYYRFEDLSYQKNDDGSITCLIEDQKVFKVLADMRLTSKYVLTDRGIEHCKKGKLVPLKRRKPGKSPYFKVIVYEGKTKSHAYLALASCDQVYTAGFSVQQRLVKNNTKKGMLLSPDRCSYYSKKYRRELKIDIEEDQFKDALKALKVWKQNTETESLPFHAFNHNCVTFVMEFAKALLSKNETIQKLSYYSDPFEGGMEYLFPRLTKYVSNSKSSRVSRLALRFLSFPLRYTGSVFFAGMANILSKGEYLGRFSWKNIACKTCKFHNPMQLKRSLKELCAP